MISNNNIKMWIHCAKNPQNELHGTEKPHSLECIIREMNAF